MAKVYISAHDAEPANALADQLRAAGHDIVSAWHNDAPPKPSLDDVAAWGAKANFNFDLIDNAEVLVLVSGPDKYPGGKFIEAGYAIRAGAFVVCYGRRENGMCAACELAPDLPSLLTLIAD